MKFKLTVLVIFVMLISVGSTSADIYGYFGKTGTKISFTLEGRSYNVEITDVQRRANPQTATFKVNNQVLPKLEKNKPYMMQDRTLVEVTDVDGYSTAFFTFIAEKTVTFEEGEDRTIQLGKNSYSIEVIIIEDGPPATATFDIDSKVTPQLQKGTTYTLNDQSILFVQDIVLNKAGEAGLGDIVTFSFSNYCGDNMCSSQENCGTCAADCGCPGGSFCSQNTCQKETCGDGICSSTEECALDNCCGGKSKEVMNDEYNCGACYNKCGYKEICEEGICTLDGETVSKKETATCGDNTCQQDEKNCCIDCGCNEGYRCEANFCIEENRCFTQEECDDNDPCTLDTCEGTPKDCAYERQNGCVLEDACREQKEIVVIDEVLSFCNVNNEWETQKAEGEACTAAYECLSNICQEGICFVKRSFVEKIIFWFGIRI